MVREHESDNGCDTAENQSLAGDSGDWRCDLDQEGDPACWAHLLCPECAARLGEAHHPGCTWEP